MSVNILPRFLACQEIFLKPDKQGHPESQEERDCRGVAEVAD